MAKFEYLNKTSVRSLCQLLVCVLLLSPCSPTQRYPEELTNVIKSGVVAALAGLIYGGLPAARHARQKYIQVSQAEIYTSRVDAVVSG